LAAGRAGRAEQQPRGAGPRSGTTVIFVGVIPQFASYHGAWTALAKMSPGWWVAITAAASINQLVPVWPFQAVLPHLRFRRGFMEIETSPAVPPAVGGGHLRSRPGWIPQGTHDS
jgi:hypothetical protein